MFPFEFRADIDFGENWNAFVYLVGGFGACGLLLVGIGIYEGSNAWREPKGYPDEFAEYEMSNPWETDTEREDDLEEAGTYR